MMSTAISVTLLLCFCLLTTVHSQGGSVTLQFAESDATGMESASLVEVTVRVQGRSTEILTVNVIPLTKDMYLATPGMYRNSCNSVISDAAIRGIDPAEVSDFDGQLVTRQIPSNATGGGTFNEFSFNINLRDDTIREPEEYFLLVLDARQPSSVDMITYQRDCMRISISADHDPLSIGYVLLINPIVVSEDAGTIQIIQVEKQEAEVPVDITFSGADPRTFMFSPATVTLQPNETSVTVSITVVDDEIAQDDNNSFTINAESQFGSASIPITIRENDRTVVGFDQTEVTVTEGETVTLSTSFKNNITIQTFQRIFNSFQVFTQQGAGNATENHYTSISDQTFVGNQIVIQTIDIEKLERPQQFEVKLTYPVSTPLVVIQPDTVTVTIKDKFGKPNKPNVTSIGRTKDDITVTWTIDKSERHPVDTYVIKIQITGSRNQDSDGDSTVEFNTTISAANANCKLNATKDHCLLTVKREIDEGKMYNVIVCAKNDLGTICSDPSVILPKPAPLKPTDRLPTGSIVGIIFGVIVAVLACCLLWMLVVLIICCTCCEREKIYNPERKEKENENLRYQNMYTKVDLSESPTNEYEIV